MLESRISIETYDEDAAQFIIVDAVSPQWSTHYGEDGSGYGYLRFQLPREIGSNYRDIGYGYRVIVRKRMNKILFDGQIRQIDESSSPDGDTISVTALGWSVVFEDDELLRAFCDKRLHLWKPHSELPAGDFRPDKYATGNNGVGLFVHAGNNAEVAADEYTYVEYDFYDGEVAERVKCDLILHLGAGVLFHADLACAFKTTISSVDDADTLTYTEPVTEGADTNIGVGNTLENTDQEEELEITGVNTVANTIDVDGDISGWSAGENIRVILNDTDLWYNGDSGEGNIDTDGGQVLLNLTQGKSATISALDAGNNKFSVTSGVFLSGWTEDDELCVVGPLFYGQIDSIAAAVITYDGATEIGETSLAAGQVLANLNKKSVATIQANNAGADTITVTNSDHIDGWEDGDIIIVGTSLWYATINAIANDGDGTGTITWNAASDIGTPFVDDDTGWTIYNETKGEYATVDGWDAGSEKVGVDDWNDIGTTPWAANDDLYIYTPFRVAIVDSDWTTVWPSGGDLREGAIPHNRTSINELTAGAPTGFKIAAVSEVGGEYGESTFAMFENLRVYSTESDSTFETLAKYAVSVLDDTGHDLNSSTDDIESIAKVLEPMVFEFSTFKEAMTWCARFGNSSDNPVAWGVRLDDTKTVFIETQDLDAVNFKVRRSGPVEASLGGDVEQSAQQVRGIYADKLGEQQVTDWQTDTDAYFSGHYKRKSIRMDSVDNDTDAVDLATIWLNENKNPKTSSRYAVGTGSVFTDSGVPIPVDELQATGGIVAIEDWRAVEAGLSGTDLRDSWTRERIAAVEVDYDAGRANLIPASAKSTFEVYMAELAMLKEST